MSKNAGMSTRKRRGITYPKTREKNASFVSLFPYTCWLNTYIGDTRGKIAILLGARRPHVNGILPHLLLLGFGKDEMTL
jgi:hypothetical protein